jgi:hypothetical protein
MDYLWSIRDESTKKFKKIMQKIWLYHIFNSNYPIDPELVNTIYEFLRGKTTNFR